MAQKQIPQHKNIPLLHGMNRFLAHKSATVAKTTLMKMNQLSDKIRRFEAHLSVKLYAETFDELMFNRFIEFLSKNDRLGDNTIASHVKTLRELLKFLSLTPINWNKFEKQFDCF